MAAPGRMRVIMTVHGGAQGLMDCMEGLVQRNERSIRERVIPLVQNAGLVATPFPIWRDGVTSLADHVASTGTIAAWRAAELRAQNKPARVAMIGGIPNVVFVDRNEQPIQVASLGVVVNGTGMQSRAQGSEGRNTEHLLLTLDDNYALPVCEINTAVARHNAKRIRQKNLPKLYTSGIVYETEGSPELWWDAEEELLQGHDDCEGLAAYRAGELINQGLDADVYCRFIQGPAKSMGGSGSGRLFHAVTRVRIPQKDGSIATFVDDPSVRLGMPVPKWYADQARTKRAKGLDI